MVLGIAKLPTYPFIFVFKSIFSSKLHQGSDKSKDIKKVHNNNIEISYSKQILVACKLVQNCVYNNLYPLEHKVNTVLF